jgi:DNA-binding beta-propeller fold protein YncE
MFRQILFMLVFPVAAMAQMAPFASFDIASEPILNDPHDLAFGPDGMLYVADKFGNRIVVMDPDTLEIVRVIAEGSLPGVHDVMFDTDGNMVVAITGLGLLAVLNISEPSPAVMASYTGSRTEGGMIHSNGRAYVMASGTGELIVYDGEDIVAVTGGMAGAHDVMEDGAGNIWVANTGGRSLVQFDADLNRLQVLSGPEFGFIGPRYLDIDELGRIVVADQDAHRILLIDPLAPEGARLVGVLGDGSPGIGPNKFDDPEGVAVQGHRYFISDSDNNRIVRYVVLTN